MPQMPPNMIYPPGAQMLSHQNYQGMHPIGYNPLFIPQYPIPQIPGYPPNMFNMNYVTSPSINGIHPHYNASPNSTLSTVQLNTDSKTSIHEIKGKYNK